jgi:anti-anti-sigma factor
VEELEAESLLTVEVAARNDDTLSVRLVGELDLSNVERLEAEVAPALARHPKRLVVEAGGLEFADSSAIALWLRWSREVDRFELRELSPLLRRVLTAMGLDGRMELGA